ncbi:MAG: hypothetical protein WBY71_10625, partial [Nitrososphaeraceae archaeon]
MSRYDDFLKQLKEDHKTTAKMAINRLYLLLKEDDPNLSKDDMYDRILKDCLVIWARATVIENMPDELKDSERQEAGRRGAEAKKKLLHVTNDGNVARDIPANSNLVEQKQIESQTLEQGSTKRDNTSSVIVDKEVDDYQISTVDHPVSSSSHNEGLLPFEFSLLVQDVLGYLDPVIRKKYHNEERVWFNGLLDKSTGEVISAAIGRRTSLDGDTCDENTDYD